MYLDPPFNSKGGRRSCGEYVHGATDEFEYRAVEKKARNHDFNATSLHLMGLDHTKLTYFYSWGRHFRLTDAHGELVKDIPAWRTRRETERRRREWYAVAG